MKSISFDTDTLSGASPEELENVTGGASGSFRYYEHVVKEGDTLANLASTYGSTVDLIFNANDIIQDRNLIKAGWKLIIPIRTKKK